MDQERIAVAAAARRNDDGYVIDSATRLTHQWSIDDRVHGFAVMHTALRQLDDFS